MSDLSPLSGVERKSDLEAVRSVFDPSRKSSTPFAVTTRPPLCHQAVLNCSPRAERWLDEATARHDTASTKFAADLRARYRNLSLRMCLGKLWRKWDK